MGLVLTETRPRGTQIEWLPKAGPRTLAALRIAVGVATLLYLWEVAGFQVPPEGLRFPPLGTAWFDFLPVNQGLFSTVVVVTVLAAFAVIAGWRPALWVMAAGVFYLGWVTTLTGKVDHVHHLMWVAVILAISPSANIWALRREKRAGSYQWPALAVIAIIGLVYFGAGVQKLTSAGLAWGWSDNFANTMLRLAWEKGGTVHAWLVDWPLAGRIIGTAGLVFEIVFLPLLLIPRTRRWVWPAGLLFHWGTWVLLGIPFLSLQLMYVVFLPWDRHDDSPASPVQSRVIVALLAVVAVFTVAGLDRAWPVAAYPGFDGVADTIVVDFEVTRSDGTVWLTDTEQAAAVGAHRIPHMVANGLVFAPDRLAEWLDAEAVHLVMVDVVTGKMVGREVVYP